jgi:hypothetical protein
MWLALLLLVAFVLPEIVAFTRPATRTAAPSLIVDRAVVSMHCGVCGGKTVDTSCGHGHEGTLLDAGAHKAGATQVVVGGQSKKVSKTSSRRREGCCMCCPAGCTCCLAGCQCQL